MPKNYTADRIDDGAGKSTEWTPAEVYAALVGYGQLNTFIANQLKTLYINGIDEDPST